MRIQAGGRIRPPGTPTERIDISHLESIVGDAKIAVPFGIPLGVENELKQRGHFLPDRECFGLLVTNPDAEKARAARMDRAQWALIPKKDPRYWETPLNTSPILGIGYKFYPKRRAPHVYGAILFEELERIGRAWPQLEIGLFIARTPKWANRN